MLSKVLGLNFDDDVSPVRRRNKTDDEDLSPIRKSKRNVREDEDLSPVRKMNENDTDLSPARKGKRNDVDISPVRRGNKRSDDDLSPIRSRVRSRSPRQSQREIKQRKVSSDRSKRIDRTLDGKLAGLQDATMLKKETEEFRRRENDLFKKMSTEVSGQHADVVVRDKKSGRVRDLERDREKDEEKKKREKERQEVYSRWGKGLKQVEDYQNKVADDQYEGNKPLARYSNDADLDKMLRDQERAGDPMLAYIRKKNNQNATGPKVPTYAGPFPENRFNIRPGYRWDGVDRSNGYEKKWLTVQNQKVAIRDEAYKYSTEDM